jgi:hypothetical protein
MRVALLNIVEAAFLYPPVKVLLGNLVGKVEHLIIRVKNCHWSRLVGYAMARILNFRGIRSVLSFVPADGIVLNNVDTSIFDIIQAVIIGDKVPADVMGTDPGNRQEEGGEGPRWPDR